MALQNSRLKPILALALTAFAIVAFAEGNVEMAGYALSDYQTQSAWLLAGSIVAAYAISDREYGELNNLELGAIAVPFVALAGLYYTDFLQAPIDAHAPWSQLVLVVVSVGCVYILTEQRHN